MISSWWEDHCRILPWRQTRDPYRVFVSEVMLQQTQVLRVIPKYNEFLEVFPDVQSLAKASTADVLRMWKGMGYNRRALFLHRAAIEIVETYHGVFPTSEQLLSKLPGVGTYTARAILVFAYEQDIAMVDTNIRKIITHFFFNGRPQKEKTIQAVADQLLPKGKFWAWHQALMDYGAIALPRNRPEQRRGTSIPFRESNRYYRGRIVDALREGSKTANELNKIANHVIIASLIKDGLIEKNGTVFELPV